MADTNNHITEAAKLSQEAYKAAKKDISQTITGMSGNTRKIFNAAVAKAAHDVNYKGEKAMAEAVQALASQGIYASTHYDKNGKLYRVPADVAVRQAVYTSGRQRFNGQVKDIALKTGKDLVEVNSTANCRPSHEAINGKIFSLSGSDPRYPKMTSDLEALFHDYNCGHQWAIYHEGLERVFEDPLEGTGYTVEEARAAVGKQRRYENSIRKQKRVVEALKAAGQETTDANRRLSALQRRLREHIEANKAVCRRERHREQLYDTARRMRAVAGKKPTRRKVTNKSELPRVMHFRKGKNIIAGVEQGAPMTFERADHMRANPNFGKEIGYSFNCQSCVVAHELRRRGYDVRAKSRTKNKHANRLANNTGLVWKDPATGELPRFIVPDGYPDISDGKYHSIKEHDSSKPKVKTAEEYLKFLEGAIKDGERYTMEFEYKRRGNHGHIVCIERMDSALVIHDPQTGEIVKGSAVLGYLKNIKFKKTINREEYINIPLVRRVDNLVLDVPFAEFIVEGA